MRNINKQAKKGYTLIELLLALGIIAVLAVGIFMLYPKVSSSYKSQAEASNINTIRAAVNSLYASSANFNGLDTETAIKAKVFPESMIVSDTVVNNGFKGEVKVGASDVSPSGSKDSAFTIAYGSVPANECVKIVSSVASGFYKVTVDNGGAVEEGQSSGTVVKDDGVALDVAKLTTACKGSKNSITFVAL
jgi:prepilin-type N-terminal cleavage/methylation domain-containing protein